EMGLFPSHRIGNARLVPVPRHRVAAGRRPGHALDAAGDVERRGRGPGQPPQVAPGGGGPGAGGEGDRGGGGGGGGARGPRARGPACVSLLIGSPRGRGAVVSPRPGRCSGRTARPSRPPVHPLVPREQGPLQPSWLRIVSRLTEPPATPWR